MTAIKLSIGLFILMFFGCEVVGPRTYELIDDFRITRHQPKTWKFYCKMGCGIYPEIDNVKKVMWNKNTIILQSEIRSNKYEWHIMKVSNAVIMEQSLAKSIVLQ